VSIGRARRRGPSRAARPVVALVVSGLAAVGLVLVPSAPGGAASSDKAIQKRAVLKKSDFAAGWDSAPRPGPTDSGLPICAAIDAVNDALAPRATRSPEFTRADADNVLANNSVVVLKSTKEAKGYLEPYRDDNAVACLESLTRASLAGARFSSVRVYVTPTDDVPSGADDAAGFEIQVTVTAPATAGKPPQTAVLHQDLVVVRVGRALANFGFLNPGKRLPEQGELVDRVIGRLEDAL
jgi:hypothetical protein